MAAGQAAGQDCGTGLQDRAAGQGNLTGLRNRTAEQAARRFQYPIITLFAAGVL